MDDITLQRVAVNSSGLLEGMRIKGTLGRFFLASHGIDLNKEDAVLNRVELSDTHVQVMLADTTETPEDTTETALNWRVALHNLKLKNVSVDLQMPLDSMSLAATIGDASIEDAEADLKRQFYGWRKFAFTGTSVNYDTGTAVPAEGFDASHIALRDIRIGIDSVMTCGRDMNCRYPRVLHVRPFRADGDFPDRTPLCRLSRYPCSLFAAQDPAQRDEPDGADLLEPCRYTHYRTVVRPL